MHYLFMGFVLAGIAAAFVAALGGEPDALARTMEALFSAASLGVEISLGLIGILALWSGFFRIAEASGLASRLAQKVAPLLGRLMPDCEQHRAAMAPVSMNLAANMLGLDNAATPLGLKAMERLQEANAQPERATDSQIMFLVLNTSSVTLVPVTVLLFRAQQGAADPADVYLPMLMATTASTFAGVWIVSRIQGIRLLNRLVVTVAMGWLALLGILGALVWTLPAQSAASLSSALGNGVLLAVVAIFLLAGHRARIDVYQTFVEGAKEGFQLAVRIIPFLVAMLAAIAVLRAGGVLDWLLDGTRRLVQVMGLDTRFVDALPVAFLKPLSGSGARAMMLEVMQTQGVDSLAGRMAAIMQGSTETTFYVLAVYFGSVGIVNLRYAILCGLFADVAGLVTAILVSYLFFAGA